jgi:hypothetical protein
MHVVVTALGIVMIAAAGPAQRTETPVSSPSRQAAIATARQSPFACDRLALSPAARTRHFEELGPQLKRLKTGVRELTDGYAFRFPADVSTVRLLAEWAAGERLCCPFFEITIRMEAEDGPLWLTLTGREGTKDFIRADAPAWITP